MKYLINKFLVGILNQERRKITNSSNNKVTEINLKTRQHGKYFSDAPMKNNSADISLSVIRAGVGVWVGWGVWGGGGGGLIKYP